MANELLLDSGALVSLLDSAQTHHRACLELFESWERRVVTSEAVLAEATHLLGRVSGGRVACLDFMLSGGAELVPSSGSSLQRARWLIEQYDDLPMDFADATLVVLAEDLDTDSVFTIDRRDFAVYRIHGRKTFTVYP